MQTSKNIKRTLLTAVILGAALVAVDSAIAAPNVIKGQCGVHTLHVLKTPDDKIIEAPVNIKFGNWNAGSCQISKTISLGNWRILTGDKYGFPGEFFKYYTSGEGKCASLDVSYKGKQYDLTPFQLTWDKDKKTYTKTEPAVTAVSIQ